MRTNGQFDLFYAKVLRSCKDMPDVGEPKLPRRRNVSNYFQIQHNIRLDRLSCTNEEFQHNEVSEYYKQLYLECVDTLFVNMSDRFHQNTLKILSDAESCIVYWLEGKDFVNYDAHNNLRGHAALF